MLLSINDNNVVIKISSLLQRVCKLGVQFSIIVAAWLLTGTVAGAADIAIDDRSDQPAAAQVAEGFVFIPGGSFHMGGAYLHDKPAHLVTLKPFAMSKHEVTFKQYSAFVKATGREIPDDSGWGQGNRPVINVNWEDASAYAKWLSDKTGKKFRLPTEAEWEYAARAGSTTRYSWGNEVGRNRANCNSCGSQWDKNRTAPVGSFDANDFGLYDMHGNVGEWVQDCWHDSYQGAPEDGHVWRGGNCSSRVIRGGCWLYGPNFMSSGVRGARSASLRVYYVGFRLVQEL